MELKTYLLLVMLKLSASNAYIKVFQNVHHRKNWTESFTECSANAGRLANPDEFSACSNLSADQNIWLGQFDYETVTPWIAKIGCYNYKNNSRKAMARNSVLECYQFCQTTTFGYNNNWCSCVDEHVKVEYSDIPSAVCAAGQIRDYVWLYNMTKIHLRENNHMLNCVSAQCTGNGTIFKAADCSLQKMSYCQNGGSINMNLDTHVNREKACNMQERTHLVSKDVCSSINMDKTNSPEFWTGLHRYRYKITEIVTDGNGPEVNSEDIFNCVYVRCPPKDGNGLVTNVKKCSQQLDGFACIFNGSVTSISTVIHSLNSTFETTTSNTHESSSIQAGLSLSMIVSPKVTILTNTQSNVATHIQTKTRGSIPPSNDTTQLSADHTSEPVASTSSASESIDVSSVSAVTSDIVTQSLGNTFETTTSNTPVSSSMQFEYKSTIVSPKPTIENSDNSSVSVHIQTNTGSSILPPNVTTELTSDHTSETFTSTSSATKVTLQQTVQTKRNSSVPTFQQTNIGRSTLPSNGIIPFKSDHTVEPVASTSDDVKGIDVSTVSTTNIDIITATFSSVKTSKYVTKNSKSNIMDNTTTLHSNSVQSKNLNTGLVVGVSVSILIVVIIGLLGICRLLRNRDPIKGNLEDTESPMTLDKDPNYHGIYFDSESKTSDLKNKYENDALKSSDDDMQFRLINNTQNSVKDTPDNAYAVVVKKTTQANNNQDKDTNIPSTTFESDNDILNQPKGSSGNESGNTYDTSEGHLDDKDPTYNTTTHVNARVTGNESDYDHL